MTPLRRIVEQVLSRLRMPVLVRVDRSYIRQEQGGYCLDGTVLRPGSMEESGEILKEVPISPIWAGKNGQGVYCPPEDGQIVIVNWISGHSAWPFVAGIWSDGITPADGKRGRLVITDGQGGSVSLDGSGGLEITNGNGAEIKMASPRIGILNTSTSLKAILEQLVDEIVGLQTAGPPSPHVVSPDTRIKLNLLKGTIGQLFD